MEKNTINWYPGHMKKTKEEIIRSLKLVNLVVELLDARAPLSSKNPDIDNMVGGRDRIIAFTKKDLGRENELEPFKAHYENMNISTCIVDATSKQGVKDLMNLLENKKEEFYQKNREKGMIKKPLRIMIVGIPNVGKSTLINTILGSKKAKVGNKPGITQKHQWLKIRGDIELLDTPGILYPKIEDKSVALNLSFLGSIKDEIQDIEDIYYELVKYIISSPNRKKFMQTYEINDDTSDFEELSAAIAAKRGFLRKGSEVDYFRLSNHVLSEFRSGKYGKVLLDEI